MADGESYPLIEEWYQRRSEWGSSFVYSKPISREFHVPNYRWTGGLSTHV